MALFSNLGNYKNFGLLIIRIGLGILFIYHGLPKLLGGPHKWEELGTATRYVGVHFLPMLWGLASAATETFGGFLVILGLAFRPVCLLLVINLVVAAFSQFGHGGNLGDAAQAIEDAVTFTGLLFIGSGKYSMDKK
ncbi:MAG TPA: DoxX family protein [Mucilaginibacter sp.]|jgi:putative oxidoreductase|nr:DoxX family protein [Mucilaginibacter sp.]